MSWNRKTSRTNNYKRFNNSGSQKHNKIWNREKSSLNKNNKQIFKHEDVNNKIQDYLLSKGDNLDKDEFINFLTNNFENMEGKITFETKKFIEIIKKMSILIEVDTFDYDTLQNSFDSFMNLYYEFKKDENSINLNKLEESFYKLFDNNIDFFEYFQLNRDNYEYLLNKISIIQKKFNEINKIYNKKIEFLSGLFDAAKTFAIYNLIRYTYKYNGFKDVLIYFYENNILPRINVTTSEWSLWNALWYYPSEKECPQVTNFFDFYCDLFHNKNLNIFELNRFKETAFVAILNSKKLSFKEKEYRYFKILDVNEESINHYLTSVLNKIGSISYDDNLILILKFLLKINQEFVIKNFIQKSIKQGKTTNPCKIDTILCTLITNFLSVFIIKDNKYLSKFFEKNGELEMMEIINTLLINLKYDLILEDIVPNEILIKYPDIYLDKKKLYEQYKASLLGSLCDYDYRELLLDNAFEYIFNNLELVLDYDSNYLEDFESELINNSLYDLKAMFVRNKINNAIACTRHSNIMKSHNNLAIKQIFSQVYFSLDKNNFQNKSMITQTKFKIFYLLENPFDYPKDDRRRNKITENEIKQWSEKTY